MNDFHFPSHMRFFQVPMTDLPEHEQTALKKNEFYVEAFENRIDPVFTVDLKKRYANTTPTPLVEYQYAFLCWCMRLSKASETIIRFVCPVKDSTDQICYQFYVVFDRINRMQYFLVNFNNCWEDCIFLFEEKNINNYVHRQCPDTIKMYSFGKAALAHNKPVVKDAFFMSPGFSLLVIPSSLEDPTPSFWNKCTSTSLEELYNRKIISPLKAVFDEIPRCLSHISKWDFIYLKKEADKFSSSKMLPVIVSKKNVNKDRWETFLKKGFSETFYSHDGTTLNKNELSGFNEIQETIQLMENFDFHDSEIIGIASYDIGWADGSHSWSCKIPVCFSELLTKFNIFELESKLPLLSHAYMNGIMNRFSEGGLIENNYKEMIYLYDYNQYNKGKANKIHIDRSAWVMKIFQEIIKFNQYIEFKKAKENKKDSDKLKDTISRGLLYQLLGSILGG